MNFEELKTAINLCMDETVADMGTYSGNSVSPPIKHENEGFTPPDNDLWLGLTVRPNDARQITFGGAGKRRYRQNGIMVVQIFCPALTVGTGLVDYVVQILRRDFTGTTRNGIVFKTPQVSEGKRSGEEWQVNVSVPFYSDWFQ